MLNRLQKSLNKSEDDKGFTLIELLVVVVIIGILAAIAIPIFLSQKDKAAEAGVKSDLKNASTSMETFFVDYNTYVKGTNPDPLADLKATTGVVTEIKSSSATGYCLEGHLTKTGATVFKLDSAKGYVEKGTC